MHLQRSRNIRILHLFRTRPRRRPIQPRAPGALRCCQASIPLGKLSNSRTASRTCGDLRLQSMPTAVSFRKASSSQVAPPLLTPDPQHRHPLSRIQGHQLHLFRRRLSAFAAHVSPSAALTKSAAPMICIHRHMTARTKMTSNLQGADLFGKGARHGRRLHPLAQSSQKQPACWTVKIY